MTSQQIPIPISGEAEWWFDAEAHDGGKVIDVARDAPCEIAIGLHERGSRRHGYAAEKAAVRGEDLVGDG
jgi:hypothetical protein